MPFQWCLSGTVKWSSLPLLEDREGASLQNIVNFYNLSPDSN